MLPPTRDTRRAPGPKQAQERGGPKLPGGICNRAPRLLILKATPKLVQIESDEKNPVATTLLLTDRELSIRGKRVGTAVLTLRFPDPADATKEKILSYLVRVLP